MPVRPRAMLLIPGEGGLALLTERWRIRQSEYSRLAAGSKVS
jgi:hypothetical protein